MPSMRSGSVYAACCGKVICRGCMHAVQSRAVKRKDDVCPFCRTLTPSSNEEMVKRYEKRMEINDPIAIYNLGGFYAQGSYGVRENYVKALELWHRAGELGSADAYCCIGMAYEHGLGVEVDKKMAKHYWGLAAIKGDVDARCNLGGAEGKVGDMDRALRHYMISTKGGNSDSLEDIKRMYMNGDATKDDYAKALRLYQAYLSEIKSDQRDEAAAFDGYYKYH